MSSVDFGRYSQDYAQHRAGYPARFYQCLESHISLSGTRALDIATGPGIIALELARRGASVTGIDMAPGQIHAAREQADKHNLSERCEFTVSRGEDYDPGKRTFDLVIAGQCWRWLDQRQIFHNARRWLRPGGLFVITNFDYVPTPSSSIAATSEELILKHNPGWTLAGKNGLYPEQIEQATAAGYALIEQTCFDHDQPFTHEAWRGRMRTCNGVGSGGMTDDVVRVFDRELEIMLRTNFPEEPLMIPHRVWTVISQPSETCA